MTAHDDDATLRLLQAARAGDGRALEQLLVMHQARIYRYGLSMCRDPEDAKDVLQETLLAMARGLRDFRGGSALSTWLYTIARRFCLKKRRKSKFAPRVLESLQGGAAAAAAQVPDPARGPDEELWNRQVGGALGHALDALAPAAREVLVLRDVEGLPAAQVAEVLGVSVDAVKSRLHRARAAVRAELEPLLEHTAPAAPGGGSACPDVAVLFSRYLEGEISAGVCADMERHLEACPRCRGTCESLKRSIARCRAAPAVTVPDAVQESVRRAIRGWLAESA